MPESINDEEKTQEPVDQVTDDPKPETSQEPEKANKADRDEASAAKKQREKKPKDKKKAVRIGSPRWVVPTMLALFGIGLLWIIVYYIVPTAPGISTLGAWNVLIGFVLISIGFVVSTKWK